MIDFSNINIFFEEKELYKDFSISFEKNSINFIMGESGVGKTTLIKYIKDQLLLKGEKVSVVYQESRLIPWKNVYRNLELVIKNKYKKEDRNKYIEEVLRNMNLNGIESLFPHELSGGMKQRINIARAILFDGDIFIMDEPFKGLDKYNKEKIIYFLKDYFKKKQKTVIIISHDINEVREFADKYILIKDNPVIKEVVYIN
ncbi:ABC transporter ATP-binding protein [Clostridium sp. Sa3CUN1]|uniref:ABC transporter ATP-binding protein n=1 Tax=Clostridium gallinarum TaxID=2762246 RepID=A0ABR8PZZ7_9CLOT|nr:ATP-binding cassette domain-containing protein [Clostridium gallinarum]MBD7913717.1 ABC transporter ATP-binding protein [Clostridium gallinarum]